MKSLASVLLSCLSLGGTAQTCTWQELPPFGPGAYALASVVHPNRQVSLVIGPGDGQGDLVIMRLDASGAQLWNKRKMALDPAVQLHPGRLEPTEDGGILVYGNRVNWGTGTTNMYAFELDSLGVQLWARMYSVPDTSFYQSHALTTIKALPGGGFMMHMHGSWPAVCRLDDQGVPVWSMGYDVPNSSAFGGVFGPGLTVLSNTDLLMFGASDDTGGSELVVSRLNSTGTPLWTNRLDNPAGWMDPRGALELANGDLAVFGRGFYSINSAFIALFDPTGVLLWYRAFDDVNAVVGMMETSAGELIAACDRMSSEGAMVMQLTSDLLPITSAVAPSSLVHVELMPSPDDTLRMMFRPESTIDQQTLTGFLKTGDPNDLTCLLTSATNPTTQLLSPTVTTGIPSFTDSMKTWTMALVEAVPNTRDINAVLTTGPARPGFVVTHYGTIINTGDLVSGPVQVVMTFDPLLTFNSAWPAPSSVVGNQITWTNIPPIEGLSSSFFMFQGTLPPDPNLLGTQLVTTMVASQDSVELDLVNNSIVHNTDITGAYDPNDKLVFPKDFYHITNDSILDYTIRFQNTGTDTAFTVVVVDTLPPNVDVMTFQAGAASHPYTYSLTGEGLLKFTFENILLPDSNVNEPMSHGLVSFRIEPMQPLLLGASITNVADIYFDFNPPVRTPDATVIVTDLTAVDPLSGEALLVYPVPVGDVLTVELPVGFRPRNAMITAADGRAVWSSGITTARDRVGIPVQQLARGAYQLTLLSLDGERASARFVKE